MVRCALRASIVKVLNGYAIEKPSADERAVQEIIEPGDMAVATSGDYRIYFERDGVRYSHIINPRPESQSVISRVCDGTRQVIDDC